MAVDWSDPCARYAALRDAYFNSLSGAGGETLIRVRGPEGEREVRFAKADIAHLREEMRSAQAECQVAQGQTPTGRYAIRAGAPRR